MLVMTCHRATGEDESARERELYMVQGWRWSRHTHALDTGTTRAADWNALRTHPICLARSRKALPQDAVGVRRHALQRVLHAGLTLDLHDEHEHA